MTIAKDMIQSRRSKHRRLSPQIVMLSAFTIIGTLQLVSATDSRSSILQPIQEEDTSSSSSIIKGQDNTNNNTPINDEPARLLKEKMKVETNRDLQSDSATNDRTYTINALASRLNKPGQNQGRQANFKRRNGGNGNTGKNRQSNNNNSRQSNSNNDRGSNSGRQSSLGNSRQSNGGGETQNQGGNNRKNQSGSNTQNGGARQQQKPQRTGKLNVGGNKNRGQQQNNNGGNQRRTNIPKYSE